MSFEWESGTREELGRMGAILDRREMEDGKLSSIAMAEQLLHVRSRWGGTIALDANTVQRSYEENRKPKNIVLKARQMGITTWVAGQFFLKTITHPGTLTVQVAHTQEAAESIFRIVRRFLRCLPQSIRQAALKTAEVSAHRIVFPGMDSEYRVETAGAPNAGRGLTITNLHASEVARWPGDPAEILEGLRAALSPAGELVLESTPMGAAGCFWKEWQEAEKTGTARHFFPWWMEETYVAKAAAEDSLSEDELRLREERHLSLRQIGYRRQMLKNFRGLAKQEYAEDANSCFLASGECLFDTDAIDQRLRDVAEPVETRQRGELRIWLHPQAGRRYLVAVDPAGGGTDGDYAVAQVIDLGTALQCAELRGHRTPLELAEESAALATEYHGALLAVERNNHGSGVLAYLRGVCRYERLYQQGGQDGWPTTAVTRPGMLGRVGSALVETPTLFQSERLLHECRSFVRHANGQSAAQAGEHDDCVMAMAIALAVREEELAGLQ